MLEQKKCPICGRNTFVYIEYLDEDGKGTIEEYGYCNSCGYVLEYNYGEVMNYFGDVKRGKRTEALYFPKNILKHKRVRRKVNKNIIKSIPINIYI